MPKFVLIVVLSVCLVMSGCASTHYAPFDNPQSSEAPAVQPGDTVRVTLKSGRVRRLLVATADAQTLTGLDLDAKGSATSTQIALSDVKKLELRVGRDISVAKTAGLVLGIAAAVIVAAYAALLISCHNGGGSCAED